MHNEERFVHLHVHSDFSSLDGAARVEDIVKVTSERGNPAAAITDHGTVRGLFTLTEECSRRGIKPIYGVELYVCDNMRVYGAPAARPVQGHEPTLFDLGVQSADDDAEDDVASRELSKELRKAAKEEERVAARKMHHLTVWALDETGLANLFRLTSKGWTEGFYYKPRIDLDELAKYSGGLAVGTGCVGSIVNSPLIEGEPKKADTTIGRLDDIFGDRLYLEIMPHDLPQQRCANEFASIVRGVGKHKLIATQDAHYIAAEHVEHHDVLLAIGSRKPVGEMDRMRFAGGHYWLKTRAEMRDAFIRFHRMLPEAMIDEALESTCELASRCSAQITINPLRGLLPPVKLPEGYSTDIQYLIELVREGMGGRDLISMADRLAARDRMTRADALRVYTERVKHELGVLKRAGFASYFIVIHEMCRWAKAAGVAKGPGRGSAAGSLVAYLLGITDVDPIAHRLMFERFIAPGRVNYPDCDLDFQDNRRAEVIEHLRSVYGSDNVAQISTMGRMNGRQVLRDVAKAFDVPQYAIQSAAVAIPQDVDSGAINKAIATSEVFRAFQKQYPLVVKHAIALEGLTKSIGVHPAGVVVAPMPLTDITPVEARGTEREQIVTAFDMRGIEGIGLLKIDVLGLRAVTMLEDAKRARADATGEPFSYEEVPLDDAETLLGFTERDFKGVFQFDTFSAYSVCQGLEFRSFDDIAAINAINRPGAIAFADEFKKRRANPELAKKHVFHERVSEITSDALGLMIYQEHVIKVATDVAGFNPGHADKLRKKIGKSEGEEALEVERREFVDGCLATTAGMTQVTADRLFDQIVKFGRYGFNRCLDVDTMVATIRGGVKAIDLLAGDLIVGFVDSCPSYQRVLRVWAARVEKRVRLIFDDGSTVNCTLEHRWSTDAGVLTAQEIIDTKPSVWQLGGLNVSPKSPLRLRKLVRSEELGVGVVVDIEVDGDHLFALSNGLISHNSHAVCYSLIAYYCMFLKRHYPLEFFWALLRNESDMDKMKSYSRDARDHGVPVLLPDINISGNGFIIDPEAKAVRGSMLEVKGVGERSVSRIVQERDEHGKYIDIVDFIARVHGRNVTKRTLATLGRSGALDSLLPNPRWFVQNYEKVLGVTARKRFDEARALIKTSERLSQWTEDQRLTAAAEVNPLAEPPHPVVQWEKWIAKHVSVPLVEVSDELMAREQTVYLAAAIDEIETRSVGDTKSLDEFPDEGTQKAIGWGKKWVKLSISGVEGGGSKAKVDWSLVPCFESLLERGGRRVVLICGRTRPEWRTLDVHYMADVADIAEKLSGGNGLTIWERMFVAGQHPCVGYQWPTKSEKRLALSDLHAIAQRSPQKFSVIGVLSHLYTRPDKRGQEMAFFGVAGLRSYLGAVCFSSTWAEVATHLRAGALAQFRLVDYSDGSARLDSSSGAVRVYQKG